jgi:hypothetical protein
VIGGLLAVFNFKAMTAKELKQEVKAMCPNCDGSGTIANGVTKYNTDELGNPIGTYTEWEPEQCEWCYYFDMKLQTYSDQLCKEQRFECAKAYEFDSIDTDGGMYPTVQDSIENANMPEL